jgi:hypothetical protein
MSSLRLSDFDYELPRELIAQVPARERTGSRMLHVDGTALADLLFTDLPRLVAPGDLLVFNDTRVIKSRLAATKATGGKVELLLERLLGSDRALFQLRASHSPKIGSELSLPARHAPPSSTVATVFSSCASRTGSRFSTIWTATVLFPCHPTLRAPPKRTTNHATRRSMRNNRARSRRQPPDSTSMRRCSARWRTPASRSPG